MRERDLRAVAARIHSINDPDAGEGFWFGPGSSIGALSGSQFPVCTLPPTGSLASVGSPVRVSAGAVRVYRRALRVSELIASWRAGPN